MKKAIVILLSALLAMTFLASCGAYYDGATNSSPQMMYSTSAGGSSGNWDMSDDAYWDEVEYAAAPEAPMDAYASVVSGFTPVVSTVSTEGLAEKIIYTVSAGIETIDFDKTIEDVYSLLAFNSAFVENSYIGGINYAQSYHGWQTYRNANFTIRVPVNNLDAFRASLATLGNVTFFERHGDNITVRFTDTQARLDTLNIQEERLLDMLRRADEVTDMIALEERLSDVRYQIESITAILRNWQNQVDYSTVTLSISEVQTLTEITNVQQLTYVEQISEGFQASLRAVGEFFKNLFKWIAINLPVLVILAVIIVVIILIIKGSIKRSRKKEVLRREQANREMTERDAAYHEMLNRNAAYNNAANYGAPNNAAPVPAAPVPAAPVPAAPVPPAPVPAAPASAAPVPASPETAVPEARHEEDPGDHQA